MNWKRRQSSLTKDRDTYGYYLRDLGYLIREAAEESKHRVATAKTTEEKEFHLGRKFGYMEVVSLMQQQADGFGIPYSELCLDDLDPERDLLTR